MKNIILILCFLLLSQHPAFALSAPPNCTPTGKQALTYTTSNNAYQCTAISGLTTGIDLGASTTQANPQILGDATSGFYTAGAGKVDVTIGGTKVMEWSSSGVNASTLPAATVGNASYSFAVRDAAGNIALSSNGTNFNVIQHGAICDGSTHPLSGYFGTLAAAQAVYPNATSLAQEIDGVAIQNAVNTDVGFLPTYIPITSSGSGSCLTSTPVSLPSYSSIIIDGVLKLANGAGTDVVKTESTTNVVIDGHGIIDGNALNQTTTRNIAGVNALTSTWTTIQNVTIQNVKNWPINAWLNGNHIRIYNVTAHDSGNSVECAAGENDCLVDHLNVYNIHDYGWAFYGGVTNSMITNSIASNNNAGGFVVLNDVHQPAPNVNISFINNQSYYSGAAGFHIEEDANATGPQNGILLIGNVSAYNDQGNVGVYGGYFIKGVTNLVLNGNISHNNGNGSSGSTGYQFYSGVSNVTAWGNISYDEGVGSTSAGSGVGFLAGGTTNAVLGGFSLYNTTTNTAMTNGFNGTISDNSNVQILYPNISNIAHPNNATLGNDTLYCTSSGSSNTCNASFGLSATTTVIPPKGFYSPAANTLAFSTNTQAALTITSTGSVGIGTTAPSSLLHIFGTANPALRLTQTGSSDVTLTDINGSPQINTVGAVHTISFSQNSVAKVNVNTNGQLVTAGSAGIGIGTAGTVSDELDVAGGIGITTTSSAPTIGIYSAAANTVGLTTNGMTALTVTATQSVGIGTSSPSYSLQVTGTAGADTFVGPLVGNVTGNITGSAPAANLTGSALPATLTGSSLQTLGVLTGTVSGANASWSGTDTANYLNLTGTAVASGNGLHSLAANQVQVSTNGTDALTITATQSIGIGTINPGSALDIQAGTNASGQLRMGAINQGGQILMARGNDGSYQGSIGYGVANANTPFTFKNGSGGGETRIDVGNGGFDTLDINGVEAMRATTTGVSIGTTAVTNKFNVAGAIGLTTTAAAPVNGIYLPSANALTVTTSGTSALTISNAQAIGMPGIASSSAAQTGTMCWSITGGNITYDPTLGCLASDQNLKQDIMPLTGALAEIMGLKPVTYYWKDKPQDKEEQMGFLAQDVAKVDGRLVAYDEKGKLRGVRYEQTLVTLIIRGMQEQQTQLDNLSAGRVANDNFCDHFSPLWQLVSGCK